MCQVSFQSCLNNVDPKLVLKPSLRPCGHYYTRYLLLTRLNYCPYKYTHIHTCSQTSRCLHVTCLHNICGYAKQISNKIEKILKHSISFNNFIANCVFKWKIWVSVNPWWLQRSEKCPSILGAPPLFANPTFQRYWCTTNYCLQSAAALHQQIWLEARRCKASVQLNLVCLFKRTIWQHLH